MIVIGVSLLVLLSLFQLTDLVVNDAANMQAGSLLRLKYLIISYAMMLVMLAAFFIEDFQNHILVLFLFFLNVTIAFSICELAVQKLPSHQK